MDDRIKCIPYPLHWTEEKMSLGFHITREVAFSEHVKMMGEASVILGRKEGGTILNPKYTIKILYKDIVWFEDHEGYEVTDDDLHEVCTEVAGKIWDD